MSEKAAIRQIGCEWVGDRGCDCRPNHRDNRSYTGRLPFVLSGDGGGSGNWRAGYYAEWDMDYGSDRYYASGYNWTQRRTVTNVNETTVTINITTLEAWEVGPGGAPVYAYTGLHLVENMSSFLTMKLDAAHLPPYATAAYVGNETISTKWGPIGCEH
jgi:hypothetical protein